MIMPLCLQSFHRKCVCNANSNNKWGGLVKKKPSSQSTLINRNQCSNIEITSTSVGLVWSSFHLPLMADCHSQYSSVIALSGGYKKVKSNGNITFKLLVIILVFFGTILCDCNHYGRLYTATIESNEEKSVVSAERRGGYWEHRRILKIH